MALAVVASLGTALGLNLLVASTQGRTRELLEGLVMLLAAGVLFYVSYWLISQSESRRWLAFLKRQAGDPMRELLARLKSIAERAGTSADPGEADALSKIDRSLPLGIRMTRSVPHSRAACSTTWTAFALVQQMSVSAFTSAVVLT